MIRSRLTYLVGAAGAAGLALLCHTPAPAPFVFVCSVFLAAVMVAVEIQHDRDNPEE